MENSTITLECIGQEILRNRVSTMFKVVRPSLLVNRLKASEEPVGLSEVLKQIATNNTTVTPIVRLPDEPAKLDINDLQNLEDIALLNSFASVAAASMIYKKEKNFDFSHEGMLKYSEQYMNNYFQVMTQGLSGLLSLEHTATNTFASDFKPESFHDEFLKKLFEDFSLPETSLKQLDSILCQISGILKGLQNTKGKMPTDYCVVYYYFTPVIGLETVRLPSLRMFNIHIEPEFVERSVSKHEKVTDFHFEMKYTDYQAKMDVSGMKYHRDQLREYVETLTKDSLENIMSLVQPKAIS